MGLSWSNVMKFTHDLSDIHSLTLLGQEIEIQIVGNALPLSPLKMIKGDLRYPTGWALPDINGTPISRVISPVTHLQGHLEEL